MNTGEKAPTAGGVSALPAVRSGLPLSLPVLPPRRHRPRPWVFQTLLPAFVRGAARRRGRPPRGGFGCGSAGAAGAVRAAAGPSWALPVASVILLRPIPRPPEPRPGAGTRSRPRSSDGPAAAALTGVRGAASAPDVLHQRLRGGRPESGALGLGPALVLTSSPAGPVSARTSQGKGRGGWRRPGSRGQQCARTWHPQI